MVKNAKFLTKAYPVTLISNLIHIKSVIRNNMGQYFLIPLFIYQFIIQFKTDYRQIMSKRYLEIVLVLATLLFIINCTSYPEGLWPLQIFGKFSLSPNQKILTYYDFNRDRNVDILTQSYQQVQSETNPQQKIIKNNTLNIYLWNSDKQIFEATIKTDFNPYLVTSMIATDFENNGKIDIVAIVQSIDKYLILYYEIACIKRQCSFYAKQQRMSPLMQSDSLPTVAQIMGRNLLITSLNNSILSTYYDQMTKKLVTIPFVGYIQGEVIGLCGKFINFFYLDYNGDCLLDIVLQCVDHEIRFFTGKQNGKFSFDSVHSPYGGQLDVRTVDVNIRDINFDGLPDIIFLGYNTITLKHFLEVHYNIGAKSTSEVCSLKDSTIKFPYHFVNTPQQLLKAVYKIQRIPIQFSVAGDKYILRFGDINNDGFTDLIIDGQNQVLLLNNDICDSSCEKQQYNSKFIKEWAILRIRNFQRASIQYENDAVSHRRLCSMSFFDFYEDGRLDILANQCSMNVTIGKVVPILNSLSLDVFFMKILLLNNLNNEKVSDKTVDFRFNSNGGHVDMYVTSLSGESMPASGDQMSHPGISLELPYIHLGLGRTNNYVEQLAASVNRKNIQEKKIWTPIVPNSQLLIVPGPQQKWVLKTFISPTAVMGIVFWFVILILVAMGCYIAHLTRKQKQEDKENEESFYAVLR